MNSETASPDRVSRLSSPTGHFAMRFSSTPRGARLARRLAGQRLDAWGIPYDCDTHHALTLIVAELAANAVRHGRAFGRDFHLSLACDTTTVRIEVTDTRTEGVPVVATPTDLRDTGRALLLVEHLAGRWNWHPRPGSPGKTVWAEYVLRAPGRPPRPEAAFSRLPHGPFSHSDAQKAEAARRTDPCNFRSSDHGAFAFGAIGAF